ncbi:phage minor capsid protein [Salipaludibacillus aurantiacus]|uniref:Phage minor capsid protein 2 n=1 Tax=Salipaludibacillus aurantiacus TaxID=1601833 RepID=A0A1H9U093_9BACI|nr:phage minor capsid protein [Salipaludibacillus aurantiacus]SES02789.1 Phage minor capsid protein 2 [Salipaludibacillus aurantiacus]
MEREELERFSRAANEIYLKMEDELLKNVARRIGRGKRLLTDIENNGDTERIKSWETELLNDLDALDQDNIETIAKYSDESIEAVEEMLQEAGIRSANAIEGELREGYDQGVLQNKPDPPRKSASLARIAETLVDNAKQSYNLINTTLLDESQKAYIDIVNRTTANVISGASTPQQALRQVTSEWSQKGVPALIDRAGKQWSTEAYVGMINRSMTNTVANQSQDARMDEYGVDLFEVSSHDGARPGCAPYQGKIYSRSGESDQYPSITETTYGEASGLFGTNCGHVKFPYIPGVSKKRHKPKDDAENKRIYEESQKQRYMERQIREAKREKSMLMEMGDGQGVHFAEEKIKERQTVLREFTKDTGRTRRISREQLR